MQAVCECEGSRGSPRVTLSPEIWKAVGGKVWGGKTTIMLWTEMEGPRCPLDFHVEIFTWPLDVFGAHLSMLQSSAQVFKALQVPTLQ